MDETTIDLLDKLKNGDEDAVQKLWEDYFHRLVALARKRLGALPRRDSDEEDVAISAMFSFYGGMAKGRFELADRDELWRLLATITARKANRRFRKQAMLNRNGAAVRGESIFLGRGEQTPEANLAGQAAEERAPEFDLMMSESCNELLAALPDEKLRTIALLRLEGLSNREIADKLDCVERSVERKLKRIRDYWSRDLEQV